MEMYKVSITVRKDGTVVIGNLPFREGEELEATLRRKNRCEEAYPLRGEPVRYKEPFGSVVADDWDALR